MRSVIASFLSGEATASKEGQDRKRKTADDLWVAALVRNGVSHPHARQ
jgi:hypothetical protein